MSQVSPNDAPWGTFAPSGWRAAWIRMLHGLPASGIWRRLALWLRKPVKGSLGDWVDLDVWGLHLRLRGKGNLSEQRLILMPQFLDAAELEALAAEVKQGGTFLDIGANAGVYSLKVASACGPAARVEAFEPDPELGAMLRWNLTRNRLANVTLHPIALGGSEGEVVLSAGDGNKGENKVSTSGSGLKVPMTTLPKWMAQQEISTIDALKIDVEGHEVAVLEPLFHELPRRSWPRLVVCELAHDSDSSLADLLTSHGYQLSGRGRLNGIYRLPVS